MNAFCYKFISGYESAKYQNQLRFARVIDKSLQPLFYTSQCIIYWQYYWQRLS